MILAIETSCDDTSVALVRQDGFVLEMVSANQDSAHQPYGGIVPEIAGRNHTLYLLPLIAQCLKKAQVDWPQIDGIAVTNRPGLIGSLIVGVVTAKSLAQAFGKPLIGINHLEGHIVAPFLFDQALTQPTLNFPYVALAVSGGHTSLYRVDGLGQYLVLGATLDDAAGEAFDKFAKMVGLGFPGGQKVDQQAKLGNPKAYDFPRGLIHEDTFQMSFSGLKSAAHRLLEKMPAAELQSELPNLCASFQEAVVDVLLAKLNLAVAKEKLTTVVITGGVSANSRLREKAAQMASRKKINLHIPPLRFCTDNAAMIGYAGALRLQAGQTHDLSLGPSPSVWLDDFQFSATQKSFKKGRSARVPSAD